MQTNKKLHKILNSNHSMLYSRTDVLRSFKTRSQPSAIYQHRPVMKLKRFLSTVERASNTTMMSTQLIRIDNIYDGRT